MFHRIPYTRHWLITALVAVAVGMVPISAQAYVGPGLGLSAIGTIFAFIGAVLLALVGFIWYPIKKLFGIGKNRPAERPPYPRDSQETPE